MSQLFSSFFLIQFCCSLFLTGLIWTIQLVHYPSFHSIEKSLFPDFAKFHAKRISLIVVPAMLLELASSVFITFTSPSLLSTYLSLNLTMVIAIWLVTFFVSVPFHQSLSKSYTNKSTNGLIVSNWARTLLWTAKSLLLIFILIQFKGVFL